MANVDSTYRSNNNCENKHIARNGKTAIDNKRQKCTSSLIKNTCKSKKYIIGKKDFSYGFVSQWWAWKENAR